MELTDLTQNILAKLPKTMIPTVEEGQLIRDYQDFFKRQEADLIQGFYDTIFNEDATRHKLNPEQRKQREQTLRQWYQVTVCGHFDTNYWKWQAYVGMVHVKHDISNAAMLSMWGWIVQFLQERLFAEFPAEEAIPLLVVLQKLQVVVSSLIVESFILTEREAIQRASGLKDTILGRFIYIEIDRLLKQGLASIQREAMLEKIA